MQRQVELIGAAWGLGGADPGCADAAEHLIPLVEARLARCRQSFFRGRVLTPLAGEARRELAISRACAALGEAVAASMRGGRFPCILGGDHSCAAGTWSGAARALHGPLGLLWIDAHMDSHTAATSPSGRMHGMPLAWLLGEADDRLDGVPTAALDAAHVCLVGVHSYEPEEAERLARLGVRVCMMDEVRSRGLEIVLTEALTVVSRNSAGYGVTIDLDAIAPEDAPAVAVPEPGGIRGAELVRALAALRRDPRLVALELAEYCPSRDRDARTARLAIDALCAVLCGAGEHPQVLAQALQRHDR